MSHSETVTAALTANEPLNGTKLIVEMGVDEWKVIVRDDDAAKGQGAEPGDHWFDGAEPSDEPMSLHQHIKYADAVYALGGKLADFR